MKETSLYRQLNIFFEDLSVMITSGQSLANIIGSIAEDAEGEWKKDLDSMHEMLNNGSTLSDAMKDQKIFPDYAKKMIASGEHSGYLEETAESLASFYDKREQMRILADSALVQPLTLLGILAVVLAAFMSLVLPIIGRVYKSLGGSSNIYMGLGYVIGGLALAVVAIILIILTSVKNQLKTKSIEEIGIFQRGRLKNLLNETELAFFMSDFSTRVAGGILFDYAFADAANAVKDEKIKKALLECADKMAQGESFLSALWQVNVFPKTAMHILNSGIRNGRVENSFEEVTSLLYKEAEIELETLVMRIEPMLTGLFTIAISASLLSVMLPLIGVITSIG